MSNEWGTSADDQWGGGSSSNWEPKANNESQSHGANGLKCTICGEPGHMKYDCPNGQESGHYETSGGCFNCGEEGHNKNECPKPRESHGACFNCGEEGHNKNECTNPRVFTGTCNVCGVDGHMKKDCPNKPPQTCNNCGQDGHTKSVCTNARKIDRTNVADATPAEAIQELKVAIRERDMDDAKEAVQKYIKNFPDMTYIDLYHLLRKEGVAMWLIPIEKALLPTLTNMDLQGNLGRKFTVTYRFSEKPERPREADGWPADEEEILSRLADAGEVVDGGLPKCGNCDELGHIAKSCPQEKQERADRPKIECYNCGEIGHRVRNCPQPRVDKFACKNCNQPGHKAADCPEPRSAEGVECHKCNETGHFSRDCPQGGGGSRGCRNCGEEGHMSRECTAPKNMANMQCRNCDEMGHVSRECPKPRDMTRLVCRNCGEKGHGAARCEKPAASADEPLDYGQSSYGNGEEAEPVQGSGW